MLGLHTTEGVENLPEHIVLCRKPVETARHLTNYRPLDLVCARIWRDWLRGISERSLSATYGFTRASIEEIVREQAQIADAERRRRA